MADPERGELDVQGQKVDIRRHYDGSWHVSKGRSYRNPIPRDVGKPTLIPLEEAFPHRDYLGRRTQKPQDLARYISSRYAKPFHLIVQATPKAFKKPQGEWRRAKLKGHAKTIIRLSVWAIGDLSDTRPKSQEELALMWLKVLLILPAEVPLMLRDPLVQLPVIGFFLQPFISHPGRIADTYPIFFSRSWDYPKYPRNILDANPEYARRFGDRRMAHNPPRGDRLVNGNTEDHNNPPPQNGMIANRANAEAEPNALGLGVPYDRSGDLERLIEPRKMMIKQRNGQWQICDGCSKPYIVISYPSGLFGVTRETPYQPDIERVAAKMAEKARCEAYWLDYRCRAQDPNELTEDVHRICDVFRGARRVYVVLPELSIDNKRFWGQRMWCLPEALLCPTKTMTFCSVNGETEEYSKVQLAAEVWHDGKTTTRYLAEHFSGLLTLSRLELISLGLEALTNRKNLPQWHQADVAHALMSLLRYRPRLVADANLFQTLARLSLANDSDRIVERAVCLLPDPFRRHDSAFVLDDALGAKLWDIEPLCQVAGVGEKNEIYLDGCQSASIRWKDVPRIYFHGRTTWKKRWIEHGWQTAPIWFIIGLALLTYGSQPSYLDHAKPLDPTAVGVGVLFFLIGLGMLLRLPWEIQRIHSGKVWGSTPWLVGFEGVLPIRQIERKFFGNSIGRLSYAPSSGLHAARDGHERLGKPPVRDGHEWTEDPTLTHAPRLPDKHRWFTLVDTGPSMHVHVFSARMPPSVALICGKEGGMLRVVLCSYEAKGNLLRKETVLRMETPMLTMTRMHSWIRLSQGWAEEPVNTRAPATEAPPEETPSQTTTTEEASSTEEA